ncbi:hypothetical protein CEXT_286711 [Caerostris extrusa]|uniref:Uncharacterized protein n=1 Tax=Caerostris extrusa TaxID=172846 RepID=A0AAV4MI82_CAEEX|nr:hypothetical protein CEXT_286711 [Caerostris extrusa]
MPKGMGEASRKGIETLAPFYKWYLFRRGPRRALRRVSDHLSSTQLDNAAAGATDTPSLLSSGSTLRNPNKGE